VRAGDAGGKKNGFMALIAVQDWALDPEWLQVQPMKGRPRVNATALRTHLPACPASGGGVPGTIPCTIHEQDKRASARALYRKREREREH
jgi:hypothetical protein